MRGEAFDRWLGARHMLVLGDSLMAQLYYSLVWLLGDTVIGQHGLSTAARSRPPARTLAQTLAQTL